MEFLKSLSSIPTVILLLFVFVVFCLFFRLFYLSQFKLIYMHVCINCLCSGVFVSLRTLKGPLDKVREENPLLFRKFTAECHKLGFPEIIRPCKSATPSSHPPTLSVGRLDYCLSFILCH